MGFQFQKHRILSIFASSEFKFLQQTLFRHLSRFSETQKRHDFQVSEALLDLEVTRAKEVLDQMRLVLYRAMLVSLWVTGGCSWVRFQ